MTSPVVAGSDIKKHFFSVSADGRFAFYARETGSTIAAYCTNLANAIWTRLPCASIGVAILGHRPTPPAMLSLIVSADGGDVPSSMRNEPATVRYRAAPRRFKGD